MASPVIVSCGEVPVGIGDNLMCVTGGEGTGKINLPVHVHSGAMLTSEVHGERDMLGFRIAPNTGSKAILHFDTEQSGAHLFKNTERARRRTGALSFFLLCAEHVGAVVAAASEDNP